MSVESIVSTIERIQRELDSLHRKVSDETRTEASKAERIAQLSASISRTARASTLQSKQRQIQALQREMAHSQGRRASLTKRIATKTAELHRHEQALYKEQNRERKSFVDSLKKRDRELRTQQDAMVRQLAFSPVQSGQSRSDPTLADQPNYDAFISHATEDKDALVRPLAEKLRGLGFSVWYDEFQLKVGDSLRRSIDKGLARSRFGIVVLSPAFFAKNWPQYELDGLVAKEMAGSKVILPLWHKISKDELIGYSPSLADKFALNTATYSIDELARELADALRG